MKHLLHTFLIHGWMACASPSASPRPVPWPEPEKKPLHLRKRQWTGRIQFSGINSKMTRKIRTNVQSRNSKNNSIWFVVDQGLPMIKKHRKTTVISCHDIYLTTFPATTHPQAACRASVSWPSLTWQKWGCLNSNLKEAWIYSNLQHTHRYTYKYLYIYYIQA